MEARARGSGAAEDFLPGNENLTDVHASYFRSRGHSTDIEEVLQLFCRGKRRSFGALRILTGAAGDPHFLLQGCSDILAALNQECIE